LLCDYNSIQNPPASDQADGSYASLYTASTLTLLWREALIAAAAAAGQRWVVCHRGGGRCAGAGSCPLHLLQHLRENVPFFECALPTLVPSISCKMFGL